MLDGCSSQREREGGDEGERGGEDEIVEQAVDFLQALLDLMTDLHLHLEVRVTVTTCHVMSIYVYRFVTTHWYGNYCPT